jgi:hypothetical protein
MWLMHEEINESRTGSTKRKPTNDTQPTPSAPLNLAHAQILADLERHPLPPESPQSERVWSRGSSDHLLPETRDAPERFLSGLVAGAWAIFALGLLPLHNLFLGFIALVANVWLAVTLIRHGNQAAKVNGIVIITLVAVLNILAHVGGSYLVTALV